MEILLFALQHLQLLQQMIYVLARLQQLVLGPILDLQLLRLVRVTLLLCAESLPQEMVYGMFLLETEMLLLQVCAALRMIQN